MGRSFNRYGFEGKDFVGRCVKSFGLDLDVRESFFAGCGRGKQDKLCELLCLDVLVVRTVDKVFSFDTVESIWTGLFRAGTVLVTVVTVVVIFLFVGFKEMK